MKLPQVLRGWLARIGFALAKKASRNRSFGDRLARRLLDRALRVEVDIDEDVLRDRGYDPDELDRYQQRR